jgi:secondary thiamine-phosphate synthase enzyme
VSGRLSAIRNVAPQLLTGAELVVETPGEGFTDITREAARFVKEGGAGDGVLLLYLRHTSASLVIQENADPDVLRDLDTFLRRIVPEDDRLYRHTAEGPDDMPSHIKAALTATTLSIPIRDGRLALGTWQAIYLFEHRDAPHAREVVLHLMGE